MLVGGKGVGRQTGKVTGEAAFFALALAAVFWPIFSLLRLDIILRQMPLES